MRKLKEFVLSACLNNNDDDDEHIQVHATLRIVLYIGW